MSHPGCAYWERKGLPYSRTTQGKKSIIVVPLLSSPPLFLLFFLPRYEAFDCRYKALKSVLGDERTTTMRALKEYQERDEDRGVSVGRRRATGVHTWTEEDNHVVTESEVTRQPFPTLFTHYSYICQ